MEIVKGQFASIKHNEIDGARIELSIALADGGTYFVVADSGEDCGPHFASQLQAEEAVYDMYGRTGSDVWDLQYA